MPSTARGRVAPWIVGSVKTPTGEVPQVSTRLTLRDRMGTWKARWGVGRMHYAIAPGLYAVGTPTDESPVLVTANYKMSFDRLRSQLTSLDAWILVLDTQGINVWCAAGKGTFGTDELIHRIAATKLAGGGLSSTVDRASTGRTRASPRMKSGEAVVFELCTARCEPKICPRSWRRA